MVTDMKRVHHCVLEHVCDSISQMVKAVQVMIIHDVESINVCAKLLSGFLNIVETFHTEP